MAKRKKRKYYYQTDTCYDCGHKTKSRHYFYRRRKGERLVRDVSKDIRMLEPSDAPLTALFTPTTPFKWEEDKRKSKRVKSRKGVYAVIKQWIIDRERQFIASGRPHAHR